jgi:ABC-type multidrug transport system ATPase subunit
LEPIIRAERLSKSFKTFHAVDDLSFNIQQGEVYGFLGQNGAGKSTTMRMLLGLIRPTAGKVYIKGEEFTNQKRQLLKYIGAIIERPDMYGYLSGWDNLRMFSCLSDSSISNARLYEVLELVGLKGREKDKVKAYSQGMKQRLGIAIALAHNPELMILDEPTNGLDPQGISEMRNLILHLSKDHGKTVLISSHLLYEIEQVASQMLIIHKGKKIIEGRVKELLDPRETLFEITVKSPPSVQAIFSNSQWQSMVVDTTDNKISLKMHPDQMPALNKWLVEQGANIMEIRSGHSLEAYFLSLTNDAASTAGAL